MRYLKKLFRKIFSSKDPLFIALDQYIKQSHQEVAEKLIKPRKKSQFVIEYERYLGLRD